MIAAISFGSTMGFFTEFWRGQSGFILSIVLLVWVSMGLSYVAPWVGWPIVGLLAIVSIWQCVGAVRFGERVLRDGAMSRVYGIYAAMGVAVVSNVIVGLGVLLPAPPVDLSGPAPKVSISGGVAEVSGTIDYQMLTELKGSTTIKLVMLNSEGGNVQAGRAIGLHIAERGLETRVDGTCYSACTLVFMGGVRRHLGAEGSLGFHGYRFEDDMQVQTVDKSEIEEKDRAYLIAQGVEARFVDQIFATAPEVLWRPERDVLNAAGVIK